VANAASFQPITASLAPGELIILQGTGLYSGSGLDVASNGAFPTSIGGVSVSIDNIPCAIYYVSATQLAVTVPYELASNTSGLANIQVTNNGALSNIVQMYFQDSAPGAFTQGSDGIGFALAEHAATGLPITTSNPAQPGEYISLYLTGLGTVTPGVADGAVGPTNPLSTSDENTNGLLAVYFDDYNTGSTGNEGTIQFAGLAPGLAGLYQINVQVPTGVLGAGDDVYVEFFTDTADVIQAQIPFGSLAAARPAVRVARPIGQAARARAMRLKGHKPLRRPARGGASEGRSRPIARQ
jgi:uncharacterized protein (TIGR03437 family)